MKRIALLSILLVLMAFTLPACDMDLDISLPAGGSGNWCASGGCAFEFVIVEPQADTLAVGDTLRIRATYYDRNHVVRDTVILWTSEPLGMAEVDAAGLVTARHAGEVWIKAAVAPSGASAYAQLQIVERE